MKLAIAAPCFNAPSETFIRDHVRTIAPGQTILLCHDGGGADPLGCPILSGIASQFQPRSFWQRGINAATRPFLRYTDGGLAAADRFRVLDFFGEHRPGAVLAEYGPTGCLLARTCIEADVPLYVHFHGYDASLLLRHRDHVRRFQRLFCSAAGIMAPSRALADRLAAIGCPGSKLHVSPYGIDPHRFRPTRRLPQRLLAVGRLVEKKAPHRLIQAFSRIASQHPRAHLDIVGEGPLAGRCRALINDLALDGRVRMLGVQDGDALALLMRQASLFVQHSVTADNGDMEGLPVAILEAMASAVPVVSTRHSGIPEAVQHGLTGVLVEEHDVNAMAAAIDALLGDPDRAEAMGAAGRERVLACFTLDKARDRLRAILGLPPLAARGDLVAA